MNTASLVPDVFWEAIEPLLPQEPPKLKDGRPRIPNRAALGGIVFVLARSRLGDIRDLRAMGSRDLMP
jgi:transposase